jgi:hypothetical protein
MGNSNNNDDKKSQEKKMNNKDDNIYNKNILNKFLDFIRKLIIF